MDAGAGGTEAVAGADVVALGSATGSMGVGFSVEALAFDIGCLPAGLLIFNPGFVP